jgi:hypothetical protein
MPDMRGSRSVPVRLALMSVAVFLVASCSSSEPNSAEVVESKHDEVAAIVTDELGVDASYRVELDPPACEPASDDGYALMSQWDASTGEFPEADLVAAFDAVEQLLVGSGQFTHREVGEGPPKSLYLRTGTPTMVGEIYSLRLVGLPDSVFLVTETSCKPPA